jgi:hypothetical protein
VQPLCLKKSFGVKQIWSSDGISLTGVKGKKKRSVKNFAKFEEEEVYILNLSSSSVVVGLFITLVKIHPHATKDVITKHRSQTHVKQIIYIKR